MTYEAICCLVWLELQIFEASGSMESLRFEREGRGGPHKGFGYVVYKNATSAAVAISTANGLDVQGYTLQVAVADENGKPMQGGSHMVLFIHASLLSSCISPPCRHPIHWFIRSWLDAATAAAAWHGYGNGAV